MIRRGISFNDIHSFYDLDLILSKAEIPPAKPKTNYIEIPGADGSVDLTEAIGEVRFFDRDCKFTFTMNPQYDLSDEAFERKKTLVSNLLNGRTFKITVHKDSDYYYEGRCTVDEYLSDKRIRKIVVTAKVKPYKFKHNMTVFKFDLSSTEKTINLPNGRKTVTPVFKTTGSALIKYSREDGISAGVAFDSSYGEVKFSNLQLVEGNNHFKVSGSGTLTISYREGEL